MCISRNIKQVMVKYLLQQNLPLFSIGLFALLYLLLYWYKPEQIYNANGSLKDFGVGYKNKTILPLWLAAIVLGIMSYFVVLYFSIEKPDIFSSH